MKPNSLRHWLGSKSIVWLVMASLLSLVMTGCVQQPAGSTDSTPQHDQEEAKRTINDLQEMVDSEKQDDVAGETPQPTKLAVDDMTVEELPGGLDNPTIEIPKHWAHLFPEREVWVDAKAKEVIVGGRVCLSQGPLEMFICPDGTKEHESIISANAMASEVHAGLLAVGADPGKPATWNPEYRAAFGPQIEIELKWRDSKTDKVMTMSARDWIRNVNTKKRMEANFVFGGSEFFVDENDGKKYYMGDSGELVCLSNFSTATIDISVPSSQDNFELLFEAFSENIPRVGTQVYAVFKPGKVIGKVDADKTPSEEKLTEKNGEATPSSENGNEEVAKPDPTKGDSDQPSPAKEKDSGDAEAGGSDGDKAKPEAGNAEEAKPDKPPAPPSPSTKKSENG